MTPRKNCEISWINWAKFISIFLVYFYHSESRSNFIIADFDKYFSFFFVNIFFMISGYLLCHSQLDNEIVHLSRMEWYTKHGKKILSNIIFRLCIPTILFSSLIYFPKILLRSEKFELENFIGQILLGKTMWFTWVLTIGELLFFLLLYMRKTSIYKIQIYGILCMFISLILGKFLSLNNSPWFYLSGIFSVFYISYGAIILSIGKKKRIQFKYKEQLYILCTIAFFFVVTYNKPCHAAINSIKTYDLLGFILSIIAPVILIHYYKKLPNCKLVNFVGRNTIGLYFLSGALPETIAFLYHKGFSYNYVAIIFISIISFIIGIIINTLIIKYASFVFDFRKLHNKTIKHE